VPPKVTAAIRYQEEAYVGSLGLMTRLWVPRAAIFPGLLNHRVETSVELAENGAGAAVGAPDEAAGERQSN
jgi:hypothetical protein